MENASKALLIAASVLIVILLIAFGMKIFNSTSGTADQVEGTMQTTEITMFNNKFMAYLGKELSASQVYSVINVVVASNATNPEHKVTLKGYNAAGNHVEYGKESFVFEQSQKYKIKIEISIATGYVTSVTIWKI